MKKKNIIETYNWLNEAFVHQTEEKSEKTIAKDETDPSRNIIYKTIDNLEITPNWRVQNCSSFSIVSNEYYGDFGKIVFNKPINFLPEYAFSGQDTLLSMTLPETITEIGKCSFWGCKNLREIYLPSRIEEIKDNMFDYCSNLQSIQIPKNAVSIGHKAFCGCNELKGDLIIPNSVRYLYDYAFCGCPIDTVTLSDELRFISDEVFRLCNFLKKVYYKGKVFTSASKLRKELKGNGVSVGKNVFRDTSLSR